MEIIVLIVCAIVLLYCNRLSKMLRNMQEVIDKLKDHD